MSAGATIVVAVSFLVPIFALGGIESDSLGTAEIVILALLYIALAYITIFFNAALVFAADERLKGGDPTLRSALRGAASRAGRILPWAVVSATVSIILRAIEERVGALGRIVTGLVGVAWSLVTFLVVPVLVFEDLGVVDAVKRSGTLFKQTWGENMAAQFGFGLLGTIAALPGIAVAAIGLGSGGALAGIGVVIGVVWVALVVVVIASLSGIFQAALYHYAVSGTVPGQHFSEQTFAQAFVPRRGRGMSGGFSGGGF